MSDLYHISRLISECTITWYAVRRASDRSLGLSTSTYVAAIMVEDFIDNTSSTPLSSVPLQMYDSLVVS